MKKLLLLASVLLFSQLLSAQCGTCNPDLACIVSPAFPTICPGVFPDATAGEYYEENMTFYIPQTFYEPSAGMDVVFQQVLVTGVTGLPFGMSVELNNPSGIYIPAESEHGCARLCGTPISPGNYMVTINIVATVFVPSFGITVNQADAFQLPLTVLEGSGGNFSFTYGPAIGCNSALVSFQGLLNASPNPTSWAWDFGNGNTSNQQFPPVQLYGDTGIYTVSLLTQFQQFVITQINVTSVNNNWCGDVEEPTCDGIFGILPDIFVQVRDSNGSLLYQSGATSNTLTGSWTGLNVVANNGPFTIQVWDEDAISANDDLGTFSFTISSAGTINFSGNGGTSGFLVINTQISDTFYNEEVITVFPSPNPILEYDELANLLFVSEPTAIAYAWYFNGNPIVGANSSEHLPASPGVYHVIVQNGFNCFSTSNEYIICPNIAAQYSAASGVVSVSGNYESYQWYYNGEVIDGATNAFYLITEFGTYTVMITTNYGCEVMSSSVLACPVISITVDLETGILSVPEGFLTYTWVRNGIPIAGGNTNSIVMIQGGNYWVLVTTDYGCSISSSIYLSTVNVDELEVSTSFTMYPNPASNGFNLRCVNEHTKAFEVSLVDITGQLVKHFGSFNQSSLNHRWFALDGVATGNYLVVIQVEGKITSLKLVVQ
jgi:hypothetical protein